MGQLPAASLQLQWKRKEDALEMTAEQGTIRASRQRFYLFLTWPDDSA